MGLSADIPAQRLHESTVSSLSLSLLATIVAAMGVLFLGARLDFSPWQSSRHVTASAPATQGPAKTPRIKDPRMAEISMRFQQAVMMLHAKKYAPAAIALHRVLELSPRLTAAHINMGYALLGLKRYREAEVFFRSAIDLDAYKGNAYWGLAESLEKRGDLQGALGAMRTYIHLAPAGDPNVRRARSALWEWDYRLKRGPVPKQEAQWLNERGLAWERRNSPQNDRPTGSGDRHIDVQQEH